MFLFQLFYIYLAFPRTKRSDFTKAIEQTESIHCSGLKTAAVVTVKRHADCIERLKVHRTKTNVLFRQRIDSFVPRIRCGSFKFNCVDDDDNNSHGDDEVCTVS